MAGNFEQGALSNGLNMPPTQRVPPKKDVALALLEQSSIYVHLDPRPEAVQVPAWFKKQPQLVLQVGLNMAVPIPDLNVDERGLSCTLSFNRAPFFCMIPWPAVFALVGENGRAMVWAEDVPAEVAAQAQTQKAPEKARSHLRAVGEHESAPPPAEKPAEPPEAAKPAAKPAATKASKAKASTVKSAKEAAKPAGKTQTAAAKAKPAATPKSRAKQPTAVVEPALTPAAQPAAAPAPAAQPAKAVQPKPEAARAATEMSKPKRELPPYLRVVK
ncbi:MAG: ClpXP protease specificity-enhancing factor SspB [Polyangiaceae bacterium]